MNLRFSRFCGRFAFLIGVLWLASFSGCSEDSASERSGMANGSENVSTSADEKKSKASKKKRNKGKARATEYKVDKLPSEEPIMVIDGKTVTQGDYADFLDVKCRVMLAADGKLKDSKAFEKTKQSIRHRVPTEIIRYELMHHYAETNGIVPSAESLKESELRLLRMCGKGAKSVDQVVARLGGASGRVLPKLIYQDALDRACILKAATNDVEHITDAEVDERMALVRKWNETAAKKDAESFEKAAKAKAEILAGGYFEKVAANSAEVSPDDGREWDTVELGELQADDPLARWLMTAKVGDISDPMEYEDVIAIFGLKRLYDFEMTDGEPPIKQYELVRCAFHAYEKIEEPASREELRDAMLEARRAEVFRELGSRLLECARVEFPHGESIFNPTKFKKARRKDAGKAKKAKSKKPRQKQEFAPSAPHDGGNNATKDKKNENKQ